MAHDNDQPDILYRAFISYSHVDDGEAKALHRRLESYRVPGKLAGSEGNYGPIPARLTPIFRDLDELSAADDLTAEIKTALAGSAALIVLCSPAAKASHWVDREIETFRALHGTTRPVLAALIEGEPEDAFPEALRHLPGRDAETVDPLAADFRKGRDGKKLAQLKLVAGLTGAPLSALIQRDAQQQLRRVMTITIVALTAMIAMAFLLVMALRAQSEAQRQRQQAEGLVEYMLTDLRDRLKGVGRLDVMTAVNERAMKYYGGQAELSDLPPESLERRARILHAMGEDDVARGQRGPATAKFKEAHRYTGALLASDPANPESLFAHGQSEYWVGYFDYQLGNAKAARPAFLRYKVISDTLNTRYPASQKYLKESAYADSTLCSIAVKKPYDKGDALSFCRTALEKLTRSLAGSTPNANEQMNLADFHAWLADAYFINDDMEAAKLHRDAQLKIVTTELAKDGRNADVIESMITSNFALAKIEIVTKNRNQATFYLNAADRYNISLLQIDKNYLFRQNFTDRINQLRLALVGRKNHEIER